MKVFVYFVRYAPHGSETSRVVTETGKLFGSGDCCPNATEMVKSAARDVYELAISGRGFQPNPGAHIDVVLAPPADVVWQPGCHPGLTRPFNKKERELFHKELYHIQGGKRISPQAA